MNTERYTTITVEKATLNRLRSADEYKLGANKLINLFLDMYDDMHKMRL